MQKTLDEYLDHLKIEKGLAANSCQAYQRDLGKYIHWLESNGLSDPKEVDPMMITRFLAMLRKHGQAPASVARAVASIRGFHKFLVVEQLCERNPADELSTPKKPLRLPGVLSIEAVDKLLRQPFPRTA